jgi:ABC-type transport system substrate-binding protein
LGYAERGSDGFRVRGGLPLSVEILYDRSNEFRERLVALLEEDLAHVGIRLDPVPLEGTAVWQRLRAGVFQAALVGFRPPSLPDLSSLWASWGTWNGAGYASARADSLIKAAGAAEEDAQVERLSRALEAQVRRDAPVTFLVFRDGVDLLSSRVRDFQGTPWRPYGDLERTWLADTTAQEAAAPAVGQSR